MNADERPEVTDAIRVYVGDMKNWHDTVLRLVGTVGFQHAFRGMPELGLTAGDCELLGLWTQHELERRCWLRPLPPEPPS